MGRSNRRALIGLGLAAFLLTACAPGGSGGHRLRGSARQGRKERGHRTQPVDPVGQGRRAPRDRHGSRFCRRRGTAIPYSALVYDKAGKTWVYTNPQGRDYVRQAIEVQRIEGDLAYLSSGPPVGTAVVTVGTAELWGVDTGVGGGH